MTSGGPARLIRVHGWWIVLVTVLVMAGAYAVASNAPIEYRSAAIVVVESRVRANTTPVAPDMGTEKQLAQSGLVVDPAAKQLGIGPGEMAEGLVVSVAPDANVLTFAYTDAEPGAAQRRAQRLAEAYVEYRNSDEAKSKGAAQAQQATLVTDAWLPSLPEERPVYLDLALGLVIGLLLGVGTALLRDRLSDRLRGRDDLAKLLGSPVLATIPRERRWRRGDRTRPVLLRDPSSPAAEAFRYLRSRLRPVLQDSTTILVTSADGREGRTTTAANLAVALAQAGRTVILVDADLRHPGVATAFGVTSGARASEVHGRDVRADAHDFDGAGLRTAALSGNPASGHAGLTDDRDQRVGPTDHPGKARASLAVGPGPAPAGLTEGAGLGRVGLTEGAGLGLVGLTEGAGLGLVGLTEGAGLGLVGLTDVLAENADLLAALRDSPVPRLRLLTAGRHAEAAADLLGGTQLRRILRTLRSRCDVVVLDCSPVLTVSDAIVLAAASDHILLVGDLRRSTRKAVTRALAELAAGAEGEVSGVLLNAPRSAGGLAPQGRDTRPVEAVTVPGARNAGAAVDDTASIPVVVDPISPAPTSTVYGSSNAGTLAGPSKLDPSNGSSSGTPHASRAGTTISGSSGTSPHGLLAGTTNGGSNGALPGEATANLNPAWYVPGQRGDGPPL
ncbi:hypothetical protein GCM10010435_80020 [Winogradskya consettensis]|uniref:Polysaccharide chain length determinant N-terminal domain-containing protein n=1 Tax=Winogradskya consettensis TaxID=113560 RepID=A0A919STK3_9ACTN|nr:P-loop NTPase [Actinoplanes consettensis]GIM77359.1 hypothetical protein Aco04nite_54950 [Actinoplanes consettensis]